MRARELRELLAEANAHILKENEHVCVGLDWNPVETAWDINNGLCEDWATYVCDHLPGAREVWIDELPHDCKPDENGYCVCAEDDSLPSHCVVKYRGKLYDAECHEGVRTWQELPIHLHKGMGRPVCVE